MKKQNDIPCNFLKSDLTPIHPYGIVLSVQSRGETSRAARMAQNGGKDSVLRFGLCKLAVADNDIIVLPYEEISLNATEIGEPAEYKWYGTNGDTVAFGSTMNTIDIHHLLHGHYTVRLVSSNGEILDVKSLIIQ